ncbi:MAG: hpcD [Rickettsiaceae bacterium]|jgi:5-carboxymethyl-2-hydroxymuconate isomerase|nr:hpcD [Rickettsiaceae bacterium]
MPHLTFEYTANIENYDFKSTLKEIHNILAEMLPTKIENCKTRIVKHDDYIIGVGEDNKAFINISIKILPGRSEELLNSITEKILNHLRQIFSESHKDLNIGISIGISVLPGNYRKS